MLNIDTPHQSKVIGYFSLFIILISLLVMTGWIFDFRQVLSIIPNGATMKFNTALLFFLSGIGGYLTYKKSTIFLTINYFIVLGILIISLLTLVQYFSNYNYNIDNYFVQDIYSSNLNGRMSPSTAICFLLLGLSFLGIHSENIKVQKFNQYIILIVIFIALISIFSYILQIPGENKVFFFNSMAIHTSVLFLLLSLFLSIKNASDSFKNLLTSKNQGSKFVKLLLPYVILLPLFLSFILLFLLNNNTIDPNFGVTIYTVLFIIISMVFVVINAIKLNHNDELRLELENSLKKTNQELSYLKKGLDASSIVVVTNKNGIIESVNEKFCEISKYNENEVIGKSYDIVNSGFHSTKFYDQLWNKINKGEVWIGGLKNKAKDGSSYWVHATIVPYIDKEQNEQKYLTIRQDITELTMLSSQYENLKLKNKEIEQFTYLASHDLQEPLRTVKSMAEILQEDYHNELDEEANTCLNFITDATNRMSDLIKGLLDYSRIGGNKEIKIIDCNKLVDTLCDDLKSIIEETETVIEIENLPIIKGYETELRLLFQNLISNAIKFTKEDVNPNIQISSTKIKEKYQFSVSDNGIGLSDNNRNIFAMFQRLHNRDEYEGTGIGLAHCEKIVHLHRGEIWNESHKNGSTFHFTIPINLN
ncbi:PAS domain-containing sensor histidine kinase [Urechidicola croceus]|uniref:histidine kinase n=1 Tax=Urechidicola croceus TaxID=1850246 RepID=A0A1D8P3Y3_9FLAO|nr:ATP-binding protein [Urechidicola croceus]AOW19294.1 hypothetical protein LPB138_00720 [Urechidicola croceus]